jgi:hypothetical protein
MKKSKVGRILFIIGIIALIVGVLDPLEGSVVLLFGGTLLAILTFINRDRHWKLFLIFDFMMAIGVIFLFYFSSLGGFGKGGLSWWWFIAVIPYPLGWFATISILIGRTIRKENAD